MNDVEARVVRSIDALGYDFRDFTIFDFIAYLQTARQRKIILNGAELDGRLHGLWVRAETADYIFFDNCTHPIHQVHHIVHEVGHMILNHRLYDLSLILPPPLLTKLKAKISDSLYGHCRMWEMQDTLEEREAEYFVQQFRVKIHNAGRFSSLTDPVTSIGGLKPFMRSLGYSD
jgi:hypothetical protein